MICGAQTCRSLEDKIDEAGKKRDENIEQPMGIPQHLKKQGKQSGDRQGRNLQQQVLSDKEIKVEVLWSSNKIR